MTTTAAAPPALSVGQPDPPMTHRQILEVLAGLLAALFTAIISSTIVSNALPTIIADLHGSQTQYTWIVTASLLAMTVSTPVWGKLSDLYSKKLLVQTAIIIFVVGSVVAGMAGSVPVLIGTRVVQGIGVGGLMANAQSIIASVIPPRDRGRYSGYMGAVMAVATVSGPLIGGIIVDTPWLGWRWCFYVCVPLAVISLGLLQRYLHLDHVRRRTRPDVLGALLIAGAASLPMIWVSFAGSSFPWLGWETAVMLGGTAALTVVLVLVETRVSEPLLPLHVLRTRTTALAIVASVGVGIAMFGAPVFLGQYFQVARGFSPTDAGLLSIPLMIGSLVGTTGSGQIITRTGRWKVFLVSGTVLLALGMLLLSTIDHLTSIWHVSVFMALVGLGMGMLLQNLVLAVQNTVDVSEVGASSASVAFFRSLGGAVGVAVLGAVLANRVRDLTVEGLAAKGVPAESLSSGGASALDLESLPPPVASVVQSAYGDATGHIFLVGAGSALVALVAVLFIREIALRRTVALTPTPARAVPAATVAVAVGLDEGMPPAMDEKPEIDFPGGEPPTELQSTDIVVGDGAEAAPGATVKVHYVGVEFDTGEQFDASWDRGAPVDFPLARLIPGWQEGIPGMRVGGRRQLVVPPQLAYGPAGGGHRLSGKTLVFVIDLLDAR